MPVKIRPARSAGIAARAFTLAACAWMAVTAAATDPAQSSEEAPPIAYESPADFGNAIARAMNDRDSNFVERFFDVHAFALRIARAASDNPKTQERIATEFEHSLPTSSQPLNLLQFQNRERTHLVAIFKRVQQHGASVWVIIRNEINGLGINYVWFELVRDGAGKLRAVDWYDLNGGWVSSSIGTLLNLRGDVSDDPATQEQIRRFQEAGSDMRVAVAALGAIPPPLGESLAMLSFRVQVALAAKDPEEARRAMTAIAAKYAKEPAGAQLLEGYYRDTQQYDRALRALDVVEQTLGADGMTSLWRATIYHYSGDERAAAKFMERATRLEPDFTVAYRGLASEYVALKDYPKANATLEVLRTRFGINITLKRLEDEQGAPEVARDMLRKRWAETQAESSK